MLCVMLDVKNVPNRFSRPSISTLYLMGVDVPCGAYIGVTCSCGGCFNINTVSNHQTNICMPEAVRREVLEVVICDKLFHISVNTVRVHYAAVLLNK